MAISHTPAKDSMRSTWRQDKSKWSVDHYLFNALNLFHYELDKEVPIHAKTDKVPRISDWSLHVWIWSHAIWPVLIQYATFYFTGRNLSPVAAFFLYAIAFQANAISQIQILRRLAHRYGFLDGDKHERDQIPDSGVSKALASLIWTTNVRPLFTLALTYDSTVAPSFSWWLPLELGLYGIVLDFWFYCYHRACHEVGFLWKYHRTHHLTKHPNPMLSAYADTEQEIIEIAIVPLLTWATLRLLGFPMGFYDWWICHEYIVFTEAIGHSGLRMYAVPPSAASWLLKLIDCELLIEDHDLHHRYGYRQAHNYGKQTRLWDKLFGTCGPRYELACSADKISETVNFPLY